jgi:hypothetical protein
VGESSRVQFSAGKISMAYQMRKDNFLLVSDWTALRDDSNSAIKVRAGVISRRGKPAQVKFRAGL